jgi:hypothetical protein
MDDWVVTKANSAARDLPPLLRAHSVHAPPQAPGVAYVFVVSNYKALIQ